MPDTAPSKGEIVARFEICRRRYLDAKGQVVDSLPGFARDPAAKVALYEQMVRTRVLDARAVALQRAGQLGTYASSLGQEAIAVGVGTAMTPQDVLVPSFREHGAQLLRGVTPVEWLLYWGGDERGCDFAGPRRDLPVCIPVGSHVPHAAGVALALQLRREPCAAVCTFGDGATSKGDFYEALNLAGVWKLPLVMVAADNGWAISVPRGGQSAAATLAQKAVAAGVRGEEVDGNDVVAVRAVTGEALSRARAGEGPTLIGAETYRLADHTTSDDARRYRDDAELEARRAAEPLVRLRIHLEASGAWSDAQEQDLLQRCRAEAEEAAQAYLAFPPQPPLAIFDYLYAELPDAVMPQRDALRAELEAGADTARATSDG